MPAALRAGIVYFLLVFALGFAFGAVRTGLTGLGFSRGVLVALEIPVILAFAWWAAGWSAARMGVPTGAGARLAMGLTMFVLLRLGELGVGTLLMGQDAKGHVSAMATATGLAETAPQLLTALFPLLRARLSGR